MAAPTKPRTTSRSPRSGELVAAVFTRLRAIFNRSRDAETEEKVTLPNQEIIAKERELIVQEIDLNKEIYQIATSLIKKVFL